MTELCEEGAEKERGEVEKKSYKRKERRGGEGLKEIWMEQLECQKRK